MDSASDILDEGALLLHSNGVSATAARPNGYRILVHIVLVLIVLISVPFFLLITLPSDPLKAANIILRKAPIIVCPVLSHIALLCCYNALRTGDGRMDT
jgi:surface polysaccharide O-acyltransferase-like enzyme